MNTYSGLRGWLKKLRHYEDELFDRPGDPTPPYVPDNSRYCRFDRAPFKPGVWIEFIFRPHNQALDDLAVLSVRHPELHRQIRDMLDRAETAYARFEEASTVFEPSASVQLESYPANDADRAWWQLQEPIRELQRRVTTALQVLDEPGQLAARLEKPEASKRRRRRPAAEPMAEKLTPKQAEAVQIVGECKGNIAEAARRLARDPATVRQHYKAGMKKLGKLAPKVKTTRMRTDKRGQDDVTNNDDRRLD